MAATEAQAVAQATTAVNADYGAICDVANWVGGAQGTAPSTLGTITLTGLDPTSPGAMLSVSTGMSQVQTKDGQIADAVMKIEGSKKAIAQKIG
jgi:hypothetical protein